MATLVVYPNADPESTSVDGRVARSGDALWADCHNAIDGTGVQDTSAYGNTCLVGKNGGGDFNIQRPFFLFDTSALGVGAVVSAVDFSVYLPDAGDAVSADNDGDDWINVVQSSPASNTALALADFDQCGAVSNPTEGSDDRKDLSTAFTIGAYNTWTLNATGRGWVSLTSITKLGLREGHDAINSAYAGASGAWNLINTNFAEQADVTQDPKLTITYTSAFTQSVLEAISLASASGQRSSWKQSAAETLSLIETLATKSFWRQAITDTIALLESFSIVRIFNVAITETISLAETVATKAFWRQALTGAISLAETVATTFTQYAARVWTFKSKSSDPSWTHKSKSTDPAWTHKSKSSTPDWTFKDKSL